LLVQPPVWYVLARDVEKSAPRMFRMDRIARPRIRKDISFRPDMAVIRSQLPELEGWHPLTGQWTAPGSIAAQARPAPVTSRPAP
jgi:hypothetical protein